MTTRSGSKTSVPRETTASARYPMRTVVRLTGVAPDTLRAWQRRYDAVVPQRTNGNARRYSEADVRRLSLLRDAVNAGHAIGDVVRLPEDELVRLAGTHASAPARAEDPRVAVRARYLEALDRLDARASEAVLVQAAALVSPRTLALEILAPILREVGERWHAGTLGIAAEHLASNQIRRLAQSLRQVHDLPRGAPRVMMTTPSGHQHDLGLVLASLLAIQRETEPVELGPDLPMREILEGAERTKASVVVLAVARDLNPSEKSLAKELRALGRAHELWLGVPATHELARLAPPIRVLTSLEAFDHALEQRFGHGAR